MDRFSPTRCSNSFSPNEQITHQPNQWGSVLYQKKTKRKTRSQSVFLTRSAASWVCLHFEVIYNGSRPVLLTQPSCDVFPIRKTLSTRPPRTHPSAILKWDLPSSVNSTKLQTICLKASKKFVCTRWLWRQLITTIGKELRWPTMSQTITWTSECMDQRTYHNSGFTLNQIWKKTKI